jgi:hypothetical protein
MPPTNQLSAHNIHQCFFRISWLAITPAATNHHPTAAIAPAAHIFFVKPYGFEDNWLLGTQALKFRYPSLFNIVHRK